MGFKSKHDLKTGPLGYLLSNLIDTFYTGVINVQTDVADDGVGDGSKALQDIITTAESSGAAIYVPNPEAFYNITTPMLVRGPVSIFGDPGGSLIKNTVAVTAPNDAPGDVFFFGNGNGAFLDDVTMFACDNITQGDDVVVSATATGISVGDAVWVRSTAYFDGLDLEQIPDFMQLNEVTAISGNNYSMLHPIDESVTSPLIAPANTSEAQGVLGNDLFVARNVHVWNISAESVNSRPIQYGNALDCTFHFNLLKGLDGIFGNAWTNCRWDVDHVRVTRKIQDIALSSSNTIINVTRADYIDTGESTVSQITLGENSRNVQCNYGMINMGEAALTSPLIQINQTRQCEVNIGRLVSEGHANNVISFISNTKTPTQSVTHDNSVKIGTFSAGSSLLRFVRYDNTGGECKRNHILGGNYTGTVSSAAVTLAGEGHIISPECVFENGGLEIEAGTTGCRVYGRFKDWLDTIGSDAHLSNELKIWSDKQQNAKEHSVRTQSVNNIQTTTANTVQYTTGAIDAGTLTIQNNVKPRVRVRVKGIIVGTTATKSIALADDTGILKTYVLASGVAGGFELEAELMVIDNTRYDAWTDLDGDRNVQARTGLDLTNNTRTIDVQAWVGNAADTIRVLSVNMIIDVGTNLEMES